MKIEFWFSQFFILRLTYGDNATRYTEEELTAQFMKILESQPGPVPPVGILTTQRRDMWAESRDILLTGLNEERHSPYELF